MLQSCTSACIHANTLTCYCANTKMCLVVTRAAGETAVVPAEPWSPEQRGGGGVS